MTDNQKVVTLPVVRIERLKTDLECPGVGRDAENDKALCFYFNRPVTDDEMRFLHEVMERAVPLASQV